MEIGSAGTSLPEPLLPAVRAHPQPDALSALPALTPTSVLNEDQIAITLQLLTSQPIVELIAQFDDRRLAQSADTAAGLLQTAVTAARLNDVPAVLNAIRELIKADPERGVELANEDPRLRTLQPAIQPLLLRLALEARSESEHVVALASVAVEASAPRVNHSGADPKNVLAAANRLLESGSQINFVRAGELAQWIVAYYPLAPVQRTLFGRDAKPPARPEHVTTPAHLSSERVRATLRALNATWRRAPLLIILLGWLFVGLAAGFYAAIGRLASRELLSAGVFEVWAIGFLVLVGFQFIVTVRRPRR